jgi:hypothetical protein
VQASRLDDADAPGGASKARARRGGALDAAPQRRRLDPLRAVFGSSASVSMHASVGTEAMVPQTAHQPTLTCAAVAEPEYFGTHLAQVVSRGRST